MESSRRIIAFEKAVNNIEKEAAKNEAKTVSALESKYFYLDGDNKNIIERLKVLSAKFKKNKASFQFFCDYLHYIANFSSEYTSYTSGVNYRAAIKTKPFRLDLISDADNNLLFIESFYVYDSYDSKPSAMVCTTWKFLNNIEKSKISLAIQTDKIFILDLKSLYIFEDAPYEDYTQQDVTAYEEKIAVVEGKIEEKIASKILIKPSCSNQKIDDSTPAKGEKEKSKKIVALNEKVSKLDSTSQSFTIRLLKKGNIYFDKEYFAENANVYPMFLDFIDRLHKKEKDPVSDRTPLAAYFNEYFYAISTLSSDFTNSNVKLKTRPICLRLQSDFPNNRLTFIEFFYVCKKDSDTPCALVGTMGRFLHGVKKGEVAFEVIDDTTYLFDKDARDLFALDDKIVECYSAEAKNKIINEIHPSLAPSQQIQNNLVSKPTILPNRNTEIPYDTQSTKIMLHVDDTKPPINPKSQVVQVLPAPTLPIDKALPLGGKLAHLMKDKYSISYNEFVKLYNGSEPKLNNKTGSLCFFTDALIPEFDRIGLGGASEKNANGKLQFFYKLTFTNPALIENKSSTPLLAVYVDAGRHGIKAINVTRACPSRVFADLNLELSNNENQTTNQQIQNADPKPIIVKEDSDSENSGIDLADFELIEVNPLEHILSTMKNINQYLTKRSQCSFFHNNINDYIERRNSWKKLLVLISDYLLNPNLEEETRSKIFDQCRTDIIKFSSGHQQQYANFLITLKETFIAPISKFSEDNPLKSELLKRISRYINIYAEMANYRHANQALIKNEITAYSPIRLFKENKDIEAINGKLIENLKRERELYELCYNNLHKDDQADFLTPKQESVTEHKNAKP